jgi:hypothetical protein
MLEIKPNLPIATRIAEEKVVLCFYGIALWDSILIRLEF